MTNNPFAQLGPTSEGIQWRSNVGRLLLIEPLAVEQVATKQYGEKTAVRATVTVLDGNKGPEVYEDTLVFASKLVAQTRGAVGEKVLGRLTSEGQGDKAPLFLLDATEADITAGVQYLDQRGGQTQAAPQQAPAQQATAQAPF